jgi:hypothetical protein
VYKTCRGTSGVDENSMVGLLELEGRHRIDARMGTVLLITFLMLCISIAVSQPASTTASGTQQNSETAHGIKKSASREASDAAT